jgi:hypothetical protein
LGLQLGTTGPEFVEHGIAAAASAVTPHSAYNSWYPGKPSVEMASYAYCVYTCTAVVLVKGGVGSGGGAPATWRASEVSDNVATCRRCRASRPRLPYFSTTHALRRNKIRSISLCQLSRGFRQFH